jgi:hypothetical protein
MNNKRKKKKKCQLFKLPRLWDFAKTAQQANPMAFRMSRLALRWKRLVLMVKEGQRGKLFVSSHQCSSPRWGDLVCSAFSSALSVTCLQKRR